MTQSRYSVLVSLCLLLALTAGFFVASRAIFAKLHSSVETAIATASPTAVIPPTPTAPRAPTPKGGKHPHASPTATTQGQGGQVVMNIRPSPANPMSIIPSSTNQVFCYASFPNIPGGTSLTFRFQQLPTGNDYFKTPSTSSFAYIYGPLQPGQWRCLVEDAGKLLGSAPFTVQ